MIKVGMMIAERYEVIEKIGTGGMSDVYRAKDHKLNRFVAVKVLKQEFSENTEFVSKFRSEAQAAAGLMHPNIVNVYDVGEENGFHYIVMELVEGITLKKYIEKKASLSVKEAVSIAIQVSMGIESAHNNHIIHRDIKPQNIIISKEGKVKVTDFGIAKAATSNTITSNVMGSVHYTSPEQVRGGFSDEKSDIYSLGITLFEMLTGRVPFNGETTVAVAIKHIQEQMPSPRVFMADIPISVEQIVLKCTQKSPDKRYQSAPELIEDLKKSLISPDENFVKIDEGDFGTTKNVSEEIRAVKRTGNTGKIKKVDVVESPVEKPVKKKRVRQEQYADNYNDGGYDDEYGDGYDEVDSDGYDQYENESYDDQYENEPYEDGDIYEKPVKKKAQNNKNGKKASQNGKNSSGSKSANKGKSSNKNKKSSSKKSDEDEYDPKMEFLTTILVVVAAVVIGCIFLYIIAKAVGVSIFPENNNQVGNNVSVTDGNIVMPDIQPGEDSVEAEKTLINLGFVVTKDYADSDTVAANMVISVSEAAGMSFERGHTVMMVVSLGADGSSSVVVPEVIGKTKAEAKVLLENAGFVVNEVYENSKEIAKNEIITQDPVAGTKAALRGSVTITVSLGAATDELKMVNLVGKTEEDAVLTLNELGIATENIIIEEEYSDKVDAGLVSSQNYQAGVTITTDTPVTIRLSKGVEPGLYKCNYRVEAPADYNSENGDAEIALYSSDGTAPVQLFSTKTTSFPVDINIKGINSMVSGVVYIRYNVSQEEQITDEEGNITVKTTQIQKTTDPIVVKFERE